MNLRMIGVVILLGFILGSCGNDEPQYSCDEKIDEWVKTHIGEIHSMTRSDWLDTDVEYRLPIYRAFTPEQRANFWRGKFQELNALPWSSGELILIREVESFFEDHLNLFSNAGINDNQYDEVELFLYKWSEKAKKEYLWSDDLIMAIIASGDKITDISGTRSTSIGGVVTPTLSCNCHQKSLFTCSPYVDCKKASCNDSSIGCGGFLLWECNGRCEEPENP